MYPLKHIVFKYITVFLRSCTHFAATPDNCQVTFGIKLYPGMVK